MLLGFRFSLRMVGNGLCLPRTHILLIPAQDQVTECTKVLNDEHSSLQVAKGEVERLKRELQQAEMDVVRQQDRVSQADRSLAETKAKVVAYQSVIQVLSTLYLHSSHQTNPFMHTAA